MTLKIKTLYHCAECDCVECRDSFIDMLNDIMLSVVTLSVVTLKKHLTLVPMLQLGNPGRHVPDKIKV
jgi:hypothetical protein